MPILKPMSAHEGCLERGIQVYLERDGRALARDFVNILDQDRWDYAMDRTRIMLGALSGRNPITYRHFVLSPDPRDGVDLETLRGITMDWVHHFFGQDGIPGILGCYEVAVVYHADNTRKIPHAHIIVNSPNLYAGQDGPGRYKRLHLTKAQVRELGDHLQQLAEQRGLMSFGGGEEELRARRLVRKVEREDVRAYYTTSERRIHQRGAWSWKQDLRDRVEIARRTSTTMDEFRAALLELGVDVRDRDDDLIYSHPSRPDRWVCSGRQLGGMYTRGMISFSIDREAKAGCPRMEEVRANVIADLVGRCPAKLEMVAVYERGLDIHEVAKTLRVIDKHGIRCQADFKRLIALYEVRASQVTEESETKYYTNRLSELREAQARSEKGDFFLGVADTHKMPEAPRYKPYASSGGKRGSGGSDAAARNRQRQRNDEQTHSRSNQSHGGASHGSSGRSGARR